MQITEQVLRVFTDAILNFFQTTTKVPAVLGRAYLKKEDEELLQDYTGAIGFSGSHEGGIYISAPRELLGELTTVLTGLDNPESQHIRDMVGELANHVAGYATQEFGPAFKISVPFTIEGRPRTVDLPTRIPTFVVPIQWKGHRACLVVGLTQAPQK